MGTRQTGIIFAFLAIILVLTSASVADAQTGAFTIVEKKIIGNVIAMELDIPAEFELTIKNNHYGQDNVEIYSLLDVLMTPVGSFPIDGASTKDVRVTVMPRDKKVGNFGISYYIKGQNAGPGEATEDSLVIIVRKFSDIVAITLPEIIDRDQGKLEFEINNPDQINLGKGTVSVSSDFFDLSSDVELNYKDTQKFSVDLKDLHGIAAGKHAIDFKFNFNGKEATATREFNLVEVIKITESEFKRTGIVSYTRDIIRKNDGNVPQYLKVELSQSIFEKLFTTYNLKTSDGYYSGLNHVAVWQRELKPGETLTIRATVNYIIPVLIIAAIIFAYIIIKIINRPRLILRKKILKVRTKGGEFALKVVLVVKNIGAEIVDVTISDRLPMHGKLLDRFGAIKPEHIEGNRLTWKFERLMAGEEHILSYITYSKVILLGTINIPIALGHYTDYKGKRKVASSTRLAVVHEEEIKEL